MIWIAVVFLAIAGLMIGFVIIARKGRALRRNQPLPPPAKQAYLEWMEDGKTIRLDVECPFYFGRSEDNDVILPDARQEFEVCIFAHKNRFAFQGLEQAEHLQVNGQDTLAGYLWDGDVLTISNQKFVFKCW